jgi:hypothetical protein
MYGQLRHKCFQTSAPLQVDLVDAWNCERAQVNLRLAHFSAVSISEQLELLSESSDKD